MKTIKNHILAAAAALMVLPSCDAILDQESPSTFDESIVFSSYTLSESMIYGIVESFCEVNSYRGRFLPWYGFNTDIEWYNGYSNNKPMDGKNEISSYGILVNNTWMGTSDGPYNLMFTGIERANLVIEGLEKNADLNDPDMAYLHAEALTLRAMIYFDLIKAWGDVPERFSSVKTETLYLGKVSRDVIFKHILADLETAIPALYLPGESAPTQNTDRINRLFAEGLYARIALAASGYALRPADGKVGTGDLGTVCLSSDSELSKEVLYPKALKYLEDAIGSGKASLYEDYETLWRNFNSFDLAAGKEVLYSIPFGDTRGRWNYTFAVKNEGATINGYTYSQGGVVGPVPSFYFKYDDRDVRKDLTCVNYSWNKDGSISPSGIAKWYFGKYRFEWMDKNPYAGGNDDGAKPIVMRYSDILLMAAEIENEINNGPDTKAREYLLEVRSRAFKGNESAAEAYVAGLASHDDFFNAIVDERAFEFCGEFLRKGDLIRWNMLKTKLDEAKSDMYDLREMKGEYSYLGEGIWYREGDDEESVEIWGFKKNEQVAPEGEEWISEPKYITFDDRDKNGKGLYSNKIENMYINDPDTRQFWPIFSISVANSQGLIVNDYGYGDK